MKNKFVLLLSLTTASLYIFATLNFSSITNALEVGKRIKSGKYQNEYHTWGNGTTVFIEKDKFSIFNDTPDDLGGLISESDFMYIQSGIFYSSYSKKYYCLVDNSPIIKVQEKNPLLTFYCSKNGWKIHRR